jgi:hypothetical protein
MTICKDADCKKQAIYNVEGKKSGLYCSNHKLEGMVDVKSKRCIHEGCDVRPNYNVEGEKTALYCSNHKLEGMVDVVNKRCIHEGCNVHPNSNVEGEKKGLYCSKHKLEGMVDVKSKRCIHEGCDIHPSFNVEGEKTALYCSKHKLEGMVDVVNKRCIHEGCGFQPIYNVEGEKTALYCSKHKLEGMVNVVSKRCKSSWCNTYAKKKYDNYCLHCYMHMFPDKPVVRNYKTKETAVAEHIKTKYSQFEWRTDRRIQDGCSRRRPDLLLDLGYQVIIIEIDENQHTDYDCSCENKRTMELSQDVGHRPIVFIRFNPDDYVDGGKKVSSCWGLNKLCICTVKKTKKNEWTERLHALSSQVDYWIDENNKTDKTIEIVQMFYDR